MNTPDRPPFLQRLQVKLAASRFFTFSLLLHLILLLFAGSVVMVNRMEDAPDFAAEGGGGLVMDESAADQPPPATPQIPDQQFVPKTPEISPSNLDVITATAPSPISFQMPSAQIKAPTMPDMSREMASLSKSALGAGLGRLPSTMAGRAGGSARNALIMKNGGKEKSEKAVLQGLRWLKANQNPDGSWTRMFPPAMTGLAVLCFLGHGETPASPEFGPTVKKGVDWLMETGKANEWHLSGKVPFNNTGVYEHAIAAYALGEYFTMTGDERVKEVLSQAIALIVDGQNDDGGWVYGYSKDQDGDTSVTGWQIQALKAAHLTGLKIAGVDAALDKAMLDLQRVQRAEGGFGYHKQDEPNRADGVHKYSLTGVGVLCTCFWKGAQNETATKGMRYLLGETEKEFPVNYKSATADLYAWYYNTQACLMFGGVAWTKWNQWFQDPIADSQSKDGSWPPTGNPKPNGPENDTSQRTGPVYRTALCILMLEVFYRYTPTSK